MKAKAGALRICVWFGGLAWLASCCCSMSARWTWLGELMVHFQPYLGAAGLVLAFALVAARNRRLAVLAASLGALLLAPMVRFLPLRGTPESRGPVFRVATLNLHRERPSGLDLEGWLERYEVDVIAFQEVSLPTARHLRELFSGRGSLMLLPRTEADWKRGEYGQALYSRFELESLEYVYEGWSGPGFFSAKLRVQDQTLHVLAAHPTRPGLGDRNRSRNAVLAALGRQASKGAGVVVLGDLNTTSFSPVFGDLLEDGRLRDSRVGLGWQPTFVPFDFLPLGLPLLALDHVLVGEGLVVLARERTENIGSDHWPVIAKLGFVPRN